MVFNATYIVAVSFIVDVNRSTRRKAHNVVSGTPRHEQDSNLKR